MSAQTATLRMLEAVNAIVDKARRKHNGIPETVVVLGASGATRNGQKHGHYAAKSWRSRTVDQGDSGDSAGEVYGEILLAGESLGRGAVDTLGTLLHELAHAYCDANDIKDTSNGNRYHNTKFKEVAEEFGLVIDKADTIGWSVTSVPPTTQQTYANEIAALDKAINVNRRDFVEMQQDNDDEQEKPKPLVRKMQCPECQEPLTVTKKWWEKQGNGGLEYEIGVGLYCGTHDMEYELFEEGGPNA